MKYKVIKKFADLQDNRHIYAVGDTFPRGGMDVSEDRIKELSRNNNKLRTPLIEEVNTKKPAKQKVEDNAD